MAYPMLESPIGGRFYYDGRIIKEDSSDAELLKQPTDEVTYYETVRIKDGILLYAEDHLARLSKSVKGIEDFRVDVPDILDKAYTFINNEFPGIKDGNLRIVLTVNHLLIHICEANIPTPELFKTGITTATLKWDRVDPNIKVFRGDYKEAVANVFARSNAYEVLLADSDDMLYEGSKSNLFAVVGNKVYSAPDDKILLGITRNRVLSSLNKAGGELVTGMFTLEELKKQPDAALFVSSTPFDILPVRSVDGVEFNSANNALVQRISDNYLRSISDYINERR